MDSRNVKATTIETKGVKVDPSECMGVANLNFRIDSRNGPQGLRDVLLVPLFVMVNAATSLRPVLLFASKGTVAASTNGFCAMKEGSLRFSAGTV